MSHTMNAADFEFLGCTYGGSAEAIVAMMKVERQRIMAIITERKLKVARGVKRGICGGCGAPSLYLGFFVHTASLTVMTLCDACSQQLENPIAVEEDQSTECPSGRREIVGRIVSFKEQKHETFGTSLKMLVKTSPGWKAYGTVPSNLECSKGDRISFIAELCQSPTDPRFGFFKKPKDAKNLTSMGMEVVAS